MDRVRDMLRSGDWLTRERIRLVADRHCLSPRRRGFLFLVATSHGGVDRQGRPLGTDFSNVYAAGTYVLDGNANAAFDPPQQFAREQAIFGAATQFYGWHYPPYLFVRRRGAGLDAVWACARGLAGGHARALFAGDAGDCCSLFPRDGGAPATDLWLLARARLPGGADQYRPRPERLSHRGAAGRRAGHARPPAARRRHSVRPPRL